MRLRAGSQSSRLVRVRRRHDPVPQGSLRADGPDTLAAGRVWNGPPVTATRSRPPPAVRHRPHLTTFLSAGSPSDTRTSEMPHPPENHSRRWIRLRDGQRRLCEVTTHPAGRSVTGDRGDGDMTSGPPVRFFCLGRARGLASSETKRQLAQSSLKREEGRVDRRHPASRRSIDCCHDPWERR